jgi:hypothetical protein
MTLRTALASSTLAIAFVFSACGGPEAVGPEKSSRPQAAADEVVPPTPPPADPGDGQCAIDAREAYDQCLVATPDQKQACADQYEAAYSACPEVTPPTPPPPPPAPATTTETSPTPPPPPPAPATTTETSPTPPPPPPAAAVPGM